MNPVQNKDLLITSKNLVSNKERTEEPSLNQTYSILNEGFHSVTISNPQVKIEEYLKLYPPREGQNEKTLNGRYHFKNHKNKNMRKSLDILRKQQRSI